MSTYFETVQRVSLGSPPSTHLQLNTTLLLPSPTSTCPSRTLESTPSLSSRLPRASSRCSVSSRILVLLSYSSGSSPWRRFSSPSACPASRRSPSISPTDLLGNPSFAIVQSDMTGNVAVSCTSFRLGHSTGRRRVREMSGTRCEC